MIKLGVCPKFISAEMHVDNAMIVARMKVALKWDKILGSSRFLLSLIWTVIVLILWIKKQQTFNGPLVCIR